MGKLWHNEETKMEDLSFTLCLHYSIFPTLRPHPKGGFGRGKTDFFCRRAGKWVGIIFSERKLCCGNDRDYALALIFAILLTFGYVLRFEKREESQKELNLKLTQTA